MAATDILSIEEGRVAIGLQSNDGSLDDPLTRYVSAASFWCDSHMYLPAVERDVAGETVGLWPDTASVAADVKLMCEAYLQEIWRLYRGIPNSGFDDVGAPWVNTDRVLEIAPHYIAPGVA